MAYSMRGASPFCIKNERVCPQPTGVRRKFSSEFRPQDAMAVLMGERQSELHGHDRETSDQPWTAHPVASRRPAADRSAAAGNPWGRGWKTSIRYVIRIT